MSGHIIYIQKSELQQVYVSTNLSSYYIFTAFNRINCAGAGLIRHLTKSPDKFLLMSKV